LRLRLLLLFSALTVALFAGCGQQHDLASISPPDDAWFHEHVASQDVPVLVDFGATWCGHCKDLEPHLERLEADYAGKLKVVRIDVDERSNLALHYGIDGLPSLFIFKNGRVVADAGGGMSYIELEDWATKHLP
jgi:thioredoxin 1